MDQLLALFAAYGLLAVFLGVLLEQLGLPTPALPLMLLAGSHSVADHGFAASALALAVMASLIGGLAWYLAGRMAGRRVLRLLCRVSLAPDTCVRQGEQSFSRRGAGTVVFGKFIPGVSVLAPPLAGAMGMTVGRFLALQGFGATLWASSGLALGAVFHAQVDRALVSLGGMGRVALPLIAGLLLAFIAFRLVRRWQVRRALADVPRIEPGELAALLRNGHSVMVLDVRTAIGGRLPDQAIRGARHAELGDLPELPLGGLADGALLVTYCACPQDASAAKAAALLAERGIAARVLKGGLDAWRAAGLPLDAVPQRIEYPLPVLAPVPVAPSTCAGPA